MTRNPALDAALSSRGHQVVQAPTVPSYPSDPKVFLFAEDGYNGSFQWLLVGDHSLTDLGDTGGYLGSVLVPRGLKVTLFTEADAKGKQLTLNEPLESLDREFRKISSVKVERVR
ncbi:hypothetical protein ACFYYS_00575 [Streptomyces sp. NPDC002120]|uniref:hypothetical protein n=1 Tax=Streptomyces sp. NPDC002120 TaxID=3364631 RepID=UPI0036A6A863